MRPRRRDARFLGFRLAEALLSCVLSVSAASLGSAQAIPNVGTNELSEKGSAEAERAPVEESDPYQVLVADAIRAYRAGALIEARDLFMRAHVLSPNARTWRGLGVVAFKLRQYRQAIEHLEQALSSQVKPLDEPLRKGAEELLRVAQRHVGRFHLLVRPSTSELWLDGARSQRASGVELVLEQGEHRLEFRHSGYVSENRQLEVRGREDLVLEVSLVRLAPEPAAQRTDTVTARKRWWKSPWLWGAVGVVVAGGVTAAAVLARSDGAKYDGGDTGKVVQ